MKVGEEVTRNMARRGPVAFKPTRKRIHANLMTHALKVATKVGAILDFLLVFPVAQKARSV